MSYFYRSLGDLAKDTPKLTGLVGAFRLELMRETFEFLDVHSRREPVFVGKHKNRSGGELKASRIVKWNPGGEDSSIGWTAAWAAVIDRGRKRSKPYSRALKPLAEGTPRGKRGHLLGSLGTAPFTRMLGSKQARGGMTRPARVALRRDWGKVIAAAVRNTEIAA